MEPDEAEEAGTGCGLRYVMEEAAAGMVNQDQSHSCQAACARQLLKDAGVRIPEHELVTKIGIIEGFGTTAGATASVLSELHPKWKYAGGSVDPDSMKILFERDSWIASLKTDRGTIHAVLVDKLEGDIVHVRDPWGIAGPGSGTGTRATIKLSDFMVHWHWAINNAVFPDRVK